MTLPIWDAPPFLALTLLLALSPAHRSTAAAGMTASVGPAAAVLEAVYTPIGRTGAILAPRQHPSHPGLVAYELRFREQAELWVTDETRTERRISSAGPIDASDYPLNLPSTASESNLVWRPVEDPSGGVWFAFVGSGTEQNVDIYLGDITGSRLIRLTTDPANDWQPSWSPDGSSLTFVSGRNGNADIYLLPGLNRLIDRPAEIPSVPAPVLLVGSAEDDLHPVWSPDGRYIAYTSHEIGPRETDLRVNAGISLFDTHQPEAAPVRLTHQAETAEFRPSFSPDQVALAYYVHPDKIYADKGAEELISIGVSVLEYSLDGDHILGAKRLVGRTRYIVSDTRLQGHSGPEWVRGEGTEIVYLRSAPGSGELLCLASVPQWLNPGHSYEQVFTLGVGLTTGIDLNGTGRFVVATELSNQWGLVQGSIPDSVFGGTTARLSRLLLPCTCPAPWHHRRWWRLSFLAAGLGAAFLLGLAVQ